MSHEEVRELQTRLTAEGCNPGPIDGIYGIRTQAAEAEFNLFGLKSYLPDARSAKNIRTLHPTVRRMAVQLLSLLDGANISAKIISGSRTYAEQDALFAKRPQVTKARGGYSNHNFGLAFDIGIFNGAIYLEESPLYRRAGVIGESIGLEWGGRWERFTDEPHFQLRPEWAAKLTERQMLAQLRERSAEGKDYFLC